MCFFRCKCEFLCNSNQIQDRASTYTFTSATGQSSTGSPQLDEVLSKVSSAEDFTTMESEITEALEVSTSTDALQDLEAEVVVHVISSAATLVKIRVHGGLLASKFVFVFLHSSRRGVVIVSEHCECAASLVQGVGPARILH